MNKNLIELKTDGLYREDGSKISLVEARIILAGLRNNDKDEVLNKLNGRNLPEGSREVRGTH